MILQVNGVVTASELTRLKESLENEMRLRKAAEEEVSKVKSQSTLKTRSGVPSLSLISHSRDLSLPLNDLAS